MEKLTIFQDDCEQKLNTLLFVFENIEILSREIKGKKEKYIHIVLSIKDIEVWIYKQECMFVCSGEDVHFEEADYSNKSELIGGFVAAVECCILGEDMSGLGSGFIKILNGKDL